MGEAQVFFRPGEPRHFHVCGQLEQFDVAGRGVVGESACADSWGRALTKREPSLSIPCFAERRYGGVLDDEMLMAAPPEYLIKAIEGMKALSRNGFRYPFPQYGVQQDARAGMAVSYSDKK